MKEWNWVGPALLIVVIAWIIVASTFKINYHLDQRPGLENREPEFIPF